jgi:hypothetical protein
MASSPVSKEETEPPVPTKKGVVAIAAISVSSPVSVA